MGFIGSIPHKKFLLLAVVFFLLGIFVEKNFLVQKTKVESTKNQEADLSEEVRLGGYKYINPLLECEYGKNIGGQEFGALENELKSLIKRNTDNGSIIQASIYYRDLKIGPWIGINEKESFSPSSLLKLPVMMAYYKLAETNPNILSKRLVFKKSNTVLEQAIRPTESMEVGREYSIEEIIERMMIYSDNEALVLLEENIDNSLIDRITLDLGIETPNATTPIDFMSVKSYASLFRILYNASYLNKEMSEKALDVLSRVKFKKGMVGALPSELTISHKFGERELPSGVKQLHDCGIVYYPSRPYLLCVMTRGTDLDQMGKVISDISNLTYQEMNVRYKK